MFGLHIFQDLPEPLIREKNLCIQGMLAPFFQLEDKLGQRKRDLFTLKPSVSKILETSESNSGVDDPVSGKWKDI